ncbi:MAG: hypothetical protein VB142_09765 [Burkholderia sp.]
MMDTILSSIFAFVYDGHAQSLTDVRQNHNEIVALGDALRAQRTSVAIQP